MHSVERIKPRISLYRGCNCQEEYRLSFYSLTLESRLKQEKKGIVKLNWRPLSGQGWESWALRFHCWGRTASSYLVTRLVLCKMMTVLFKIFSYPSSLQGNHQAHTAALLKRQSAISGLGGRCLHAKGITGSNQDEVSRIGSLWKGSKWTKSELVFDLEDISYILKRTHRSNLHNLLGWLLDLDMIMTCSILGRAFGTFLAG